MTNTEHNTIIGCQSRSAFRPRCRCHLCVYWSCYDGRLSSPFLNACETLVRIFFSSTAKYLQHATTTALNSQRRRRQS